MLVSRRAGEVAVMWLVRICIARQCWRLVFLPVWRDCPLCGRCVRETNHCINLFHRAKHPDGLCGPRCDRAADG